MSIIVNGVTIPTNGNYISYGGTQLTKVDVVKSGVRTTVWEKVVFEDKTLSYTGGMQSVSIPPGLYKLEVWGAKGGNSVAQGSGSESNDGGLGGYSCRYYYFSSTTTVYICCGAIGSNGIHSQTPATVSGGYNGGGKGGSAEGAGGGSSSGSSNGASDVLIPIGPITGGGTGGGTGPDDYITIPSSRKLIVNGTTIPESNDYIKIGSTNITEVKVVKDGSTTTVWKKQTGPVDLPLTQLGQKVAWYKGGVTLRKCSSEELYVSVETKAAGNSDWELHIDTGAFACEGHSSVTINFVTTFNAGSSIAVHCRMYYDKTQDTETGTSGQLLEKTALEGNQLPMSFTQYIEAGHTTCGVHVWFHGSNVRGEGLLNQLIF
ncbi:MAG: hypothetical protein K2L37_03285, partial [Lactobacillus sp.]|nr:hypothetical protein [Lactobacillus sp.]